MCPPSEKPLRGRSAERQRMRAGTSRNEACIPAAKAQRSLDLISDEAARAGTYKRAPRAAKARCSHEHRSRMKEEKNKTRRTIRPPRASSKRPLAPYRRHAPGCTVFVMRATAAADKVAPRHACQLDLPATQRCREEEPACAATRRLSDICMRARLLFCGTRVRHLQGPRHKRQTKKKKKKKSDAASARDV